MIRIALRAAALALLVAPAAARGGEVLVFAAASMKTALDAVAASWSAETGMPVALSYAGSSTLAQQIIAGAPAELFISASPEWMDAVAAEGLVAERRDLLGNALVLIAHDPAAVPVEIGAGLDLGGLLGDEKLAMALVDAVPVGQYGKAALQSLGLWAGVAAQVAQADNARAALALVATGEAPYGIVYATDAAAEPRVHVLGVFPAASHPPIVYPAALIAGAGEAARGLFAALSGPAARAVFAAQGVGVLDPAR